MCRVTQASFLPSRDTLYPMLASRQDANCRSVLPNLLIALSAKPSPSSFSTSGWKKSSNFFLLGSTAPCGNVTSLFQPPGVTTGQRRDFSELPVFNTITLTP